MPDCVRVVVSCNKNSRSYNYLINKITSRVNVAPFDYEKKLEMFERYAGKISREEHEEYQIEKLRNFIISNEHCENAMFLKLLLHFSLMCIPGVKPMSYRLFENAVSVEQIFETAVEFYSNHGFHKNIIIMVLGYLAVNRCGLTIEELARICSHSESVLRVLEVFSVCLFSYDDLWMVNNDVFSKVIIRKYYPNPCELHLNIIESLNNYKTTVRTVLERVYHYKESKEWMALKDCLCTLEIFSIMYTPQYRLELFTCWIRLNEHHFDPVQEYNKALEHFVEQNTPKNQEIFIILVQFCRFFKEFSDLEISETCEFRHPPLKRLHELKELNIFDEINLLNGVINQTQVNPLRKDESFGIENKNSRSQLKESILTSDESYPDAESPPKNERSIINYGKSMVQKKVNEMYHYKRWLWIEFPWCSLDVYSDFSQIMSVFSASDMNLQHDNEIAISTLKIIREARLKASKRYVPPKKSLQIRVHSTGSSDSSVTAFAKASGILNESLVPVHAAIQLNPISEKSITRHMSRGVSLDNFVKKNNKTDYNFDLMFKELTPSNVLVKVGAKVADYSNHEIMKKKKENNELQINYNRLVNEARMKNLQLESIKSQIAKSEDKMKEGREIALKIERMKKKMERMHEKINKAEVESKRLEQIITCCFKNAAKNDLWENGLEKGVQNMTDLIEIENLELAQYEEEEEILSEQVKEFETWFQDKIKIQENTLDRVVEQFSFKASIKEAMISGENKRAILINTRAPQRSESYFNHKLKDHKITLKKITRIKESLEDKIHDFEKILQRLQTVATVVSPQDITSVIWQIEKNEDLNQTRIKLDEKLKDLKSQKDALEIKLNFLKKKDAGVLTFDLNPETANQNIAELEKRITFYSGACKKQELSYYSCEGIIRHLTNLLGIRDKIHSNASLNEMMKSIGDKILSIKAHSVPSMFRSQTLKLGAALLQLPYSSKFNIEEIHTPLGSSALLNHSYNGSPSPSPLNTLKGEKKKIIRKTVLRLPH